MCVIVHPFQRLGRVPWTRLPELLHSFVAHADAELAEHDAGEFPIMEAAIERFEPGNFLAHRLRDAARPPSPLDLDRVREQAHHPVLAKATLERAHGIGMRLRFLRSLGGSAIGEQDQGPNAPRSAIASDRRT